MVKKIKKYIKKKPKAKYIKDKCVANFILQHLEEQLIDFSKIKIPPFLDFLNNGEDESKSIKNDNLNKKAEDPLEQKNKNLPKFGFSFLNELLEEKREPIPQMFNSSIFQKN